MTPPRLLGRVSAINIMSYGARPLGSALGAIVGGLCSAEACLYLAAAVFGVQALVILLSPAVALDRQPEMVDDEAAVRSLTTADHCQEVGDVATRSPDGRCYGRLSPDDRRDSSG